MRNGLRFHRARNPDSGRNLPHQTPLQCVQLVGSWAPGHDPSAAAPRFPVTGHQPKDRLLCTAGTLVLAGCALQARPLPNLTMADKDIVGIIQVPLNAYTYQPDKGRDEDPAIVKHLSDIFEQEGCDPNLWEHHIKGEIDAATYSKLLTALGLSEDNFRSTLQTGRYPRVRLRKRIICLDGRQRIAAARGKFGKKFWWPVKLYRDPSAPRFSHETKYPDGEICWHLFRLALGKADLGGDWRAELTKSKKKILNLLLRRENGIFTHKNIVAALCAVLEFPGTRREFKLGTMHKYTPLQCSEELERYLLRMSRIYWGIIGQKASLIPYMDSKTFGCLEGRNPSNGVDRRYIRYMMDEGTIFQRLKSVSDRRHIKRNLLSLDLVFPTLKTFHQNMMYFSVGVKILRDHIIDDPEESREGDQSDRDEGFFQSLRRCWTPPTQPLIEVSERVVQPLVSLDAKLASMLLFLDGQRDSLYLSNEPFLILQDKRGEPTPAAAVDPWYVFRLQARARQYGFYTEKIRHGLAVKPLSPRPMDWNLDETCRAKQWRGGKPTVRNFLDLRRDAFLPTLDEADGREEVTAVFVQKDFLQAFFGPWSYMTDGAEMPSRLPSFPREDRMQIDEDDQSLPHEAAMQLDKDLPNSQPHNQSFQQTLYNHRQEHHQIQEPPQANPLADQIHLPLDPALRVDQHLVLTETIENPIERGGSGWNSRYRLARQRGTKPRSRSPSRNRISKNHREWPSRSPIRPPGGIAPVSSLSAEELVRQFTVHSQQNPQASQPLVQSPSTLGSKGSLSQVQDTAGLSRLTIRTRDKESSQKNHYKPYSLRKPPYKGPRSPIPRPGRAASVPSPLSTERLEETLLTRSPILPPNSTHLPQPSVIPNPSPVENGPLGLQEPALDRAALRQTTEDLPRGEEINHNTKPFLESAGSAPVGVAQPEDPAERAKPAQEPAETSWPALPESPQAGPKTLTEPAEIPTQQTVAPTHAGSTLLPSRLVNDRHPPEIFDRTADTQQWPLRPPIAPPGSTTWARGPSIAGAPENFIPNNIPLTSQKSVEGVVAIGKGKSVTRAQMIRPQDQEPETPRRSNRIRLLYQKTQTPRLSNRIRLLRQQPPTRDMEIIRKKRHKSYSLRKPRNKAQNKAVQNALEILSQPEDPSILPESNPLSTSASIDLPQLEDPAQAGRAKPPQVQTTEDLAQGRERRKLRKKHGDRSRSRQRSRRRSRSPSRTSRWAPGADSRSADSQSRRERSIDGRPRLPITPPGRTRARGSRGDAYIRSQSWSPSFQSRRNHQERSKAGQPQSIPPPIPTTLVPTPPRPAYAFPPTGMQRNSIQRTTEGLRKKAKRKASRQRNRDPRGRSRRRSDSGSSSSQSPISRKRRRSSPPLQGLLTLPRDYIPSPGALFKPIQSPTHSPQDQVQESPKDPLQANIPQQARESSVPSNAADIFGGSTSAHANLLRKKLAWAKGKRKAVQDGAESFADGADQALLFKSGVANLQSSGPRSPIRPPGNIPRPRETANGRSRRSSGPRSPVRPPRNIPPLKETTNEGQSRRSSVCTTNTFAVPISSSDEGSSNEGEPTPSRAQTPIPRQRRRSPIRPPGAYPRSPSSKRSSNEGQPTPSQARTPITSAPSDEGKQRGRSPICPPRGAYPRSSSSKGSLIEGRGQSHIRRLPSSGSAQQSSGQVRRPEICMILDPTSRLEYQHLSQGPEIYPQADDYWEDVSVEEEKEKGKEKKEERVNW